MKLTNQQKNAKLANSFAKRYAVHSSPECSNGYTKKFNKDWTINSFFMLRHSNTQDYSARRSTD